MTSVIMEETSRAGFGKVIGTFTPTAADKVRYMKDRREFERKFCIKPTSRR